MPFRDTDNLLRDIADAIGMIETFTSGMDLEAFREDPKTVAAVERKLQSISEAAIRLESDAEKMVSRPTMAGHTGYGELAASPVRRD